MRLRQVLLAPELASFLRMRHMRALTFAQFPKLKPAPFHEGFSLSPSLLYL